MSTPPPSRHAVWQMFDAIAPTYDLINSILSCRLDKYWRQCVANLVPHKENMHVLDCAMGTGEQTIALCKKNHIESVVGIDFSPEMLRLGQAKIAKKGFDHKATALLADMSALPFAENSFECLTMAFGIRNALCPHKALLEAARVLKPGGTILLLEGTPPSSKLLQWGFAFYARRILPLIGYTISRHPTAYQYLCDTMLTFPYGAAFLPLLQKAGFENPKFIPLSGGLASIYVGNCK